MAKPSMPKTNNCISITGNILIDLHKLDSEVYEMALKEGVKILYRRKTLRSDLRDNILSAVVKEKA